MADPVNPIDHLARFPLLTALFGRRSRRFGLGMELPSGPLAFRSRSEPVPLTETELALLVVAATGVTGWSFGVPYGPRTPDSQAEFSVRLAGRTAPTAAGIGTPVLFYTDDDGCYLVNTRDVQPAFMRAEGNVDLDRLVASCRAATTKIKDSRLDLPSSPPHVLAPNLWWANKPGSALFMPVGDASEEFLGVLALMLRHGVVPVDQDSGEPAGDLERFVEAGLLDPAKRMPLAELLVFVNDSLCLELAFMGHNIVLMLQALGLGGLYFNGMDGLSVLGSNARNGVGGLGFRFLEDERWLTPNPVGLDGHYEALCPPYYPDMRAAVEAFVERKFGPQGAYDPTTPGPWRDPAGVKSTVAPYDDDFVACMVEVSRYVNSKYGKFPGTRSTIMLPGFVQANHLDTDFYDANYQDGAYLETHATHFDVWHRGLKGDGG